MTTQFEIDNQRIANRHNEILDQVVRVMNELVLELKRLNDREDDKIKY